MSKTRFVASDGLPAFLAFLSKDGSEILVPQEREATAKPSVFFAPWKNGDKFTLAKATVPPRRAVLPESEVLFRFRKTRKPDEPAQWETILADHMRQTPVVVFGCRPCDARGFDCLDRPYLKGLYEDPYYKARRERLTVITLTCDSGCETCFCHWVGGGPTSPQGSDILLTRIENGYILQAITPRGEEVLNKSQLEDGADKFPQAEEVRKKAWASLVPAPKLADAPKSLAKIFTNMDFWHHWTDRCISCGACTYFCPTCYCFNITDEGEPESATGGRRLRSWDNCMSSLYTREASGHNPRSHKAQRMRNRVSHKFWTFPENWGMYLCSGCGRCITRCPVHLDIRAITLAAIEAANAAGTEE